MKKRFTWITVIVVIVGIAAIFYFKGMANQALQFQFTSVSRGNLMSTVSSTGSLSAVGTVNVGTQVSGTISTLCVDYNDKVHKGQTLAVLDTTVLASAVRDAEANMMRSEALNKQAIAEYQLKAPLYENGFLSSLEYLPIQTNLDVTKAGLKSSEAALARARTNLSYSIIVSPIDGTVIERNIDAGQTVAASFSTPTLFVIANDLSRMQIFASVDESDIGIIRLGQKVKFNVQTYTDESFSGTVQQIRLKPITIQNVVSYTVVINALNDKGLLLPGMTATVDFILSEVEDVLCIPNGALRYEPTPAELAQIGSKQGKEFSSNSAASSDSSRKNERRRLPKNMARIWILDENKQLSFKLVQTGITDGKTTEITSGDGVMEGMEVITGILGAKAPKRSFSMTMRRPH